MRKILFAGFLWVSAASMVAAAAPESVSADGKLIVTVERDGGEFSIKDILVVQGAAPAIHVDGDNSFRLLGGDGEILAQGRLHIPRYVYHDKADRNGKLDGFRRPIDGPVTITLPYFKAAEIVEIHGKDGELLLREELNETAFRKAVPTTAGSPGGSALGEYLRTLEPRIPAPGVKPSHPAKPTAYDPAKVTVTGAVSVPGVSEYRLIWTYIAFYKHSDGTYVDYANTDTSGNFSIQLDPGDYYIEATCWYYDPAFNEKPVLLYPSPLTIAKYSTGAGSPLALNLKWDLNNLFKGL
ncbi:MAG TPA: hypothetical protein VMX35_11045, partial [Acidobacteriota bacterium]|nr:hypothetical protein [Acidobacteriota bacterium]